MTSVSPQRHDARILDASPPRRQESAATPESVLAPGVRHRPYPLERPLQGIRHSSLELTGSAAQARSKPRLFPSSEITQSPTFSSRSRDRKAELNLKSKPKDPSRPNGLYQPSRGAQRDAKWRAKTVERSKGQVVPLPTRSRTTSTPSDYREGIPEMHGYEALSLAIEANGPSAVVSSPACVHSKLHDPVEHHLNFSIPSPNPNPLGYGHEAGDTQLRTLAAAAAGYRAEQQAAIAAAREAHLRELQHQAMIREEYERKTRRIQMQVFVHARPTPCRWQNCKATLNSWAVLEKHLYHSHLHPSRMPKTHVTGKLIKCGWAGCQLVFGKLEECYSHCLRDHMALFCARCPFDCLFEGPTFPSLMAHIARRHPTATPDDFIPGLIHFPPILPDLAGLPPLPTEAKIPPLVAACDHAYVDHDHDPDSAAGSPLAVERATPKQLIVFGSPALSKTISEVRRGCFAIGGKREQRKHWAEKEGDKAAISAILENCRRRHRACQNIDPQQDDSSSSVRPEGGEPGETEEAIMLLDPVHERKEAIRAAKSERRTRADSSASGGIRLQSRRGRKLSDGDSCASSVGAGGGVVDPRGAALRRSYSSVSSG